MKDVTLVFDEAEGSVEFIHDDDAADLARTLGGDLQIRRASHVEPDDQGEWTVDLTPSGGPVFGGFARRADALAAEVRWLQENRGL